MKNKLLATTALVGIASLVSGPAISDVKFGGNLEQTWISKNAKGSAGAINSTNALGSEANIQVTYTKDMSGGLKMEAGIVAEDNTAAGGFVSDTEWLKISSGAASFQVAQDYGNTIETSLVPFISEGTETSAQTAAFNDHFGGNIKTIHEAMHVALDYAIPGGSVTYRYAPDVMQTRGTANSALPANAGSHSGTEYLIRGQVIEGLVAQIGKSEESATNGTAKKDLTVYGASYAAGNLKVGANFQTLDQNTSGTADKKSEQYGVAYKINDAMSAGVYYTKTSQTSSSPDEKVKAVQVGYNLMGLGLELSYSKVTDNGNSTGNDFNVVMVRTIQKF
jgi:hypothetical protein